MLPLVTRATQEVLRLVPSSQREGALALGASRWRTVLGVVLPSALGGIVTGTVLAVARAVGETAPLLFVTSIYANTIQWDPRHALPNMPVQIFIWSESPDPADHERAWATALVLIVFVLVTSLLAQAGARPQPQEHDPMTEEDEVSETVTMPPMRPVDVAERDEARAALRRDGLRDRGLTARYGSNIAVKDVNLDIQEN